jgi:hypothetical protein
MKTDRGSECARPAGGAGLRSKPGTQVAHTYRKLRSTADLERLLLIGEVSNSRA